jgi:RNA polymerase sigma-70 factor (ECF subfamily)
VGGALAGPDRHAGIAARILGGDRTAEDELQFWAQPRVYSMLLARTRDREASRDLCQDVMISALQALRAGQLRDHGKLAAFVQGIARNLANNYLRARSGAPPHDPLCDLACEPSAPEIQDLRHEAEVRIALERLPAPDREILSMSFVEGLKPGKIAARLGLTPEAARQRKARALRRLEQQMQAVTKRRP